MKGDVSNPAALKALLQGDDENFRVASTPGGIEQQEASGQRDLVLKFDRLPKAYGYGGELPRAFLEQLGFKIGDDIDNLFVAVVAPPGWSMRPTPHSMHSDVVDDKGRVRGGVFYKAAFYDRKANLALYARYYVDTERQAASDGGRIGKFRAVAKDRQGEVTVHAEAWIDDNRYDQQDEQRDRCSAFLDKRFPNWGDLAAYW